MRPFPLWITPAFRKMAFYLAIDARPSIYFLNFCFAPVFLLVYLMGDWALCVIYTMFLALVGWLRFGVRNCVFIESSIFWRIIFIFLRNRIYQNTMSTGAHQSEDFSAPDAIDAMDQSATGKFTNPPMPR